MQNFWVVDEFVEKHWRLEDSHQGRSRFLSAALAAPTCPFQAPRACKGLSVSQSGVSNGMGVMAVRGEPLCCSKCSEEAKGVLFVKSSTELMQISSNITSFTGTQHPFNCHPAWL